MKAPTSIDLTHLLHTIARRVGRFLERKELLERDAENSMTGIAPAILLHFLDPWRSDAGGRATQGAVAENSYLAGEAKEAGPLDQLLGYSITYRIAVGLQQGRKVFTLPPVMSRSVTG